MMRYLILISSVFILLNSCNLRDREQALNQRSSELDQKEQELLLKEKSLQLREDALGKKEKQADSTSITDTSAVYDQNVAGVWSVKMVCTEATCPGSAVGDIKNETWSISYQGKNILVRAMTNEQLVRVYSGIFNGNFIELTEDKGKDEIPALTKIAVRLRFIDKVTLEGKREILREGNCKIVYSVNMIKQ